MIDEVCDVYKQVFRKARKAHKCEVCLGEIPPGSRYSEERSLLDGQWAASKSCEACYGVVRYYVWHYLGDQDVPTADWAREYISETEQDLGWVTDE